MKCNCYDAYRCIHCDTLAEWKKQFKESSERVYKKDDPHSSQAWKDEFRYYNVALSLMYDLYAS